MSSPPLTRWCRPDKPGDEATPPLPTKHLPPTARDPEPAEEPDNPAEHVVDDDNQPLTRWVVHDSQDVSQQPTPYLYNETLGTGPESAPVTVYAPDIPILDDTNDTLLAAVGEPDDDVMYLDDDDEQEWCDGEVVGWDDTVFLPLGIQLEPLGDVLVAIATDDEIQIDYNRKENTLRIRADTKEGLRIA
ncbi:hypothetical protein HDU87_001508 [Geranomyces variabilis]|uniref:Uncharacterized protein n=1 Tax=Geranomyces variabilis TaxID=109894 RepID=A0AAD5XL94_9FUNG|nr:hypothetical protein HDU87_001508 [Geranomyces variabilis]